MGRIIALDIGDKRIGIAISDPFGEMALPYETYKRVSKKRDIEYLVSVANSKFADLIVCGIPYNFDGSMSAQTQKTLNFIDELKKSIDIPVVTEDERFTTSEAKKVLLEADMRREKRKEVIDKIAASYILEGYMIKQKNKGV